MNDHDCQWGGERGEGRMNSDSELRSSKADNTAISQQQRIQLTVSAEIELYFISVQPLPVVITTK